MGIFIRCKKTFSYLQYIQQTALSLRHRRNLTSVSNVCEAAPMSLSWAPNGLNELPFQRANHDAYSNFGAQVGAKNKDFGAVSQTELTRVKFR